MFIRELSREKCDLVLMKLFLFHVLTANILFIVRIVLNWIYSENNKIEKFLCFYFA